MKKILFITAFPPNVKGGGEIFSLSTIKNLSRHFLIDLVYFTYPGHECIAKDYVSKMISFSPSYINCMKKLDYYPLFSRRFSKTVLAYLKSIIIDYDILYFDYSQTALYSLYLNHPCKIIRCHDVIVQKISRKYPFLKFWVKYNEKKILSSASKIFTFCDKDSKLIHHEYGLDAIATNEYVSNKSFVISGSDNVEHTFIFFGFWGRRENLEGLKWFIEKVYPLINNKIKKSFVVMGSGLSDVFFKKYLEPNNINYLGFVNDCLSEIYKNSALICPLFQGAGIKVKVLDAFTTGTPVIGTDIAFEGIPDIDGLTFRCSTPNDFASTINNFTSLKMQDKIKLQNIFFSLFTTQSIADLI